MNRLQFANHILRSVEGHRYLIPKKQHKSTLIFLHGLGDEANSYLDIFQDSFPIQMVPDTTKVILLTAPLRKVTKYGGETMTSWFDMKSSQLEYVYSKCSDDDLFDIQEANESLKNIQEVMNDEGKKPIVLSGFSQGCCMALHCGLSHQKQINAIFGYSGFLFRFTQKNQQPLIKLFHGKQDEVINYRFADKTYGSLQSTKTYYDNLSHTINIEGLTELSDYMLNI